MIFGYTDYFITGDSFTKFYRRVMSDKLPVRKMCEKGEKLSLRIPAEHCKALEKLCGELGLDCTPAKRHGSFVLAKRFFGRGGLVIGTAAVMLSCVYLSNVVVRFDILSDDESIRKGVMSVLKAEGIETGTYIPSIDLIVTERALKQKVEGISWAGITRKGNTLIIDVIETEGDAKRESNRYPSNLVACENGVIEKVEVFDGQLKIPVGSGVTKGDIVVGGEIVTSKSSWVDGKENIETKTSYARSKGRILGTFERTVTFTQPFEDTAETMTGKNDTKRFFTVFDADIPLFISKPEGYWKNQQSYTPLSLFGLEMPFGITTCDLEEYKFSQTTLTEQQALDAVHHKAFLYEENFLSDYEIKGRQAEDKVTENGVSTTVTYTLYGELCREVEFFIKK